MTSVCEFKANESKIFCLKFTILVIDERFSLNSVSNLFRISVILELTILENIFGSIELFDIER